MMNDQSDRDGSAAVLAPLGDERIDEIEAAVFGRIGRERQVRARSRRRGWVIGASAAAVVVLIVAIAPVVGSFVRAGSAGTSAVSPAVPDAAVDSGETGKSGDQQAGAALVSPAEAGREVITTSTATVRVDDVSGALAAIGAAAEDRGGYVESSNLGSTPNMPLPMDGSGGAVAVAGGYITVRVPADQLAQAVAQLDQFGDVEASGVSNQDVTAQTVDLRARIDATRTSVDRLTQLMAQAASVGDLIAAESALAERQATLESYEQQLNGLDEQVELSSLSVTLLPKTTPVNADPAGFGDGLTAGFNGLVATVNAIVIGVGFLLPWIVVAGIAALVVWFIVRIRRRARASRAARSGAPRPSPPTDARS